MKPAPNLKKRKKLALVISHLGAGGAQRVVANALNMLAEQGLELHLLVFTDRGDAYPVDPRVTRHVWLSRGRSIDDLDLDGGTAETKITSNHAVKVQSRVR